MKEILISIQPEHIANITTKKGEENGKPVYKKSIELRKSRPTVKAPFKCYIYATKPKKWFKANNIYTSDESLWLANGIVKMCDSFEIWANYRETEYEYLSGKVIGEFVCDKIDEWKYLPDGFAEEKDEKIYYITSEDGRATCLTYDEIENYGKGKTLYGWHITDLKIYSKPEEINKFESAFHCFNLKNVKYKENAYGEYVSLYQDNSFCRICKYYNSDFGYCDKPAFKPLKKAPQSWQYVKNLWSE